MWTCRVNRPRDMVRAAITKLGRYWECLFWRNPYKQSQRSARIMIVLIIYLLAPFRHSIIHPMNNTKEGSSRGWVLVIGVLLILALTAFSIVWVVRDTIERTVSPVESMTGDLGTRVSQVLNPTPTILPDPMVIVRDIRSLARLETIQFRIEKVIRAEIGNGIFGRLFGDRLIFVAHGIVIAGIDLGKFGPESMKLKDGVLIVELPEPEIFIATLDNEKSYVFDRDTGLFTKGDVNLESTARRAAEEEIRLAAIDGGILDLAQQNAEHYMERLLRDLGYPEVFFIRPVLVPTPTE